MPEYDILKTLIIVAVAFILTFGVTTYLLQEEKEESSRTFRVTVAFLTACAVAILVGIFSGSYAEEIDIRASAEEVQGDNSQSSSG